MTEDECRIVVDCPVCKRTMWAGTRCTHGQIPPPSKEAPKETVLPTEEKPCKTR